MKNDAYQIEWHKLFNLKTDANTVAQVTQMNPKAVELYQGFVRSHYRNSLKKMFLRLSEVWNCNWSVLTDEYFEKYPPYAWDLNDLTRNFPAFLTDNKKKFEVLDHLIELAYYELAEFFVYKSPQEIIITENWQVNPTAEIRLYQYEIASWVKDLDDGVEENVAPTLSPNILAVARSAETDLCVFTSLTTLDVGIVEVIKQMDISKKHGNDLLVSSLLEILPSDYHSLITNASQLSKRLNFLQKQSLLI